MSRPTVAEPTGIDTGGADRPGARRAAERLAHRTPLWTLAEKVRPEHCALVVIDVQNEFCAPGGMMDCEGLPLDAVEAMARRIPATIDAARAAGATVVFVRNTYSTGDNHYLSDVWLEQATRRRAGSYTLREVCAEGSFGWRFFEGIEPLAGEPVVTKHRFGAFHATDLDVILRSKGVRTVVFVGVASNVCVETSAREAFLRDYYVVFTSDGTAAYDDESHRNTLAVIDRYFGEVVPVADVEAAWGAASVDPAGPNR